MRAGVNNVTDKAPPIVGSDIAATSYYGAGNTFPGMYDANGRYFFRAVPSASDDLPPC